jgi:hypothetical protein
MWDTSRAKWANSGSGLIVYVDWENAWLEHVQTNFPGLHLKWAGSPLLPAATNASEEILAELAGFAALMLGSVVSEFNREPILTPPGWSAYKSDTRLQTSLRKPCSVF